jgi:mono/diheme cytochrome c family protein
MPRLFPARPAIAAGALVLLLFVTRTTPAENASHSRDWKAPTRAASTTNPIRADDRSLAAGKGIYLKECAACHGETGRGNGPDAANLSRQPPDFAAPLIRQQTDGEFFWKITEGKKPMPRFARSLNDEQRWHLVNYIRSFPSNAEK